MSRNGGLFCAILALLRLISGTANSGAADFYQGKTFTIVVGATPGGGIDIAARGVARHISDHIPGKPTTIVQNMPGAGSLTAVRYLDANAPKDGTVMTIFNPGLVTLSLVEPNQVNVDFTKFKWVGVVSSTFFVCYGQGPNGVRSWDDMMSRKEIVLGATGRGGDNYLAAATLRDVFHAPIKLVLGYPGQSQRRMEIERGELDGDCGSITSIPVEWLRDGSARIFVRFSEQRIPEIPESVPYIGTFAKSEDDKQLVDLLTAAIDKVGRPFIMSNQVPPDRLAVIRAAFDATMDDPGFRSDMQILQMPVVPMTGGAAQDFIAKVSATPPDVIAKARPIYE
jgi:tripartite-type tricarboxylate transporter receptor subunit TctC